MYKDIIKKVAAELGIPVSLANNIYKAYWKSVKEHMTNLPLKEGLSQD